MVVTIVADVLGKENNGTTIACMNLIRYLKSKGDEVRIVCCDKDRKGEDDFYVVPTMYLGCLLNYVIKKNEVSLAKPKKDILEKAIIGSDVVHIMIPFKLGRAALKIAIKNNIPVTAGFHCQAENFTGHLYGLMNSFAVNHLVYKNFYNKFYNKVDAIHYPTEFIKDVFEKAIKNKTNAYVISNGVNDKYCKKESFKPIELQDKFIILFIGRFSKEKSHEVLINAIKYSKYKEDIQLVFAGSGPRRNKLIKCAKKAKINMPIMNFYSRDELIKVINYADLYCHPSVAEIEAISCLEAICCGKVPVISNSERSATKYFALDNLSLFECNNSKDLASKIDFWIENPKLKEEYSIKYLQNVNKFNQDECMKKMRNMLLDVIDNKGENNE